MTIEQKAQRYNEALKRAMRLYEQGTITESLSYIFPELKESEDERIRKELLEFLDELSKLGKNTNFDRWSKSDCADWICWLEKQKTSEEAIQYLKENHSPSEVSDFQTAMNIAVAKAYDKGVKDGLEKQGEQKGYTFKSIPRLLDMIEPSDKANAYCQKLIDTLVKEGYNTDAKIVEEVLKGWNGEDVPMAVMDEQKPFDYENTNIQQTDFAPKVDMPRYSIGDVLCDKSCTTLDKEAQPNFEIIDIRNGMYICDKCSFPISQQDEYELVAKKIEQKPTDEEIKTLLRTEYEKGRADAIAEIQNPVDCIDCTNSKGCINCEDGNMKETLVQKTAWSEEDENILDAITYTVKNSGYKHCIGVSNEMMITFIKSLKGRVQPKQEWSEEDEAKLKSACALIRNTSLNGNEGVEDFTIDWLKSLKERIKK